MSSSSTDSEFQPLDLSLSPEQVVSSLSHLNQLVFLDSAGHLSPTADPPFSIVSAKPKSTLKGDLAHKKDRDALSAQLAEFENEPPSLSPPPSPYPSGAAIGYLSYDLKFHFGFYPELLIFDHQKKQWFERGQLSKQLKETAAPPVHLSPHWIAHTEKTAFLEQVNQAQKYISAGDIYQVNLSQKFSQSLPENSQNLLNLYQTLRHSSPAPMGAYLNFDEHEILSASPETFIQIKGQSIETRPIKGTRPRDLENDSRDLEIIDELTSNPKEQAELIMITDLLRNDLGRVCEFGSVKTPHLLHHEKLAHVHHLVSTVQGQLPVSYNPVDILHQILPGGSITGAPKKRATEIIDELETVPRGAYTGTIGYLGFNRQSQFNIIIRSLIRNKDELSYHVGAGIVADSDPELEYEETLQKARGLRKAIATHTS